MALIDKLTAIAEAIRSKTNTSEKLTLDEMPSVIEGIQSGGEDYARFAKTITFQSLNIFGKEKVELNLDNIISLSNLFQITISANKNTIVEHLTINASTKVQSVNQMLYSSGSSSDDNVLKRLTFNVDTSACTAFSSFCSGRLGLEVIDGTPLNFSENTATSINGFARCSKLIEFRVVENSIKVNLILSACSKLSDETIKSIIGGLADLTGQTAQTITWHKDIEAKLSEEQKAQITSKNWTIAFQ